MHNIGAVAEIKLVIVQLVDRLNVICADMVPSNQVIDQVGVEGVHRLLFRQRDLHAIGQNAIPELDCERLKTIKSSLLDRRNRSRIGGGHQRHIEVEHRLFTRLEHP